MPEPTSAYTVSRRSVLQTLAALGIGNQVFQRSVAAQAEKSKGVTEEMIAQAEWISGIKLSEEDRRSILNEVNRSVRDFEVMRKIPLPNSVSPALTFIPGPWLPQPDLPSKSRVELTRTSAPKRPDTDEDLAFLPVSVLATLIRTQAVTALELTKLYLARLKKYDPILKCVVTLTEELALKQAQRADQEIAAGRYRGPLHGIPWGAKDLIAYPGYKTTWGAAPFKDQELELKATVARKLEEAGAILVAKLSLGALAMGDQWFGGMTRNPWNTSQGSSGSSAGSASAVAAGLVGFAIGSETLGSIVSPCSRCGATGLRPTFGRVSRFGCMTLAWSMDKLGPIARSIEDCALVFGAIQGVDGFDSATVDRPFHWPNHRDLRSLKVGYVEGRKERKDRAELKVLGDLGVQLVPIKLPDQFPLGALITILNVEAATAFDDLTRRGVTEGLNSWPVTFRAGQFVPAVEYLRANRIRTLLMQEMAKVMELVDLYVGGDDLVITNLTGHPTVVLPGRFRKDGDGERPSAITFTGRLYGETDLLAVAHAYQESTAVHLRRPRLDNQVNEKK